MTLAGTTPVPTPTIEYLLRYYEPDAPPVPADGSAEIRLRWGDLLAALGALAALITGGILFARRLLGKKRQ